MGSNGDLVSHPTTPSACHGHGQCWPTSPPSSLSSALATGPSHPRRSRSRSCSYSYSSR
ncbi:hypothetical protein HYC85_029432 [Camellia sinensis]|uniref:Uncharacterized protein n=1 Tax=Camellia sinensis TaxID=4442 RepID=A0A7J7FZ97_CAMSI|nr:hypothetical protein HYC85_029432 [Camellia sinensis]